MWQESGRDHPNSPFSAGIERVYVSPATTVKDEGPFANLTFSVGRAEYVFFDSRTGEIWQYDDPDTSSPAAVSSKFRLSQLGQPLTKEE
jgi:hypothetical protein